MSWHGSCILASSPSPELRKVNQLLGGLHGRPRAKTKPNDRFNTHCFHPNCLQVVATLEPKPAVCTRRRTCQRPSALNPRRRKLPRLPVPPPLPLHALPTLVTMASQVKDEDVDTLMAITSQLSRDQAVRFLKVGMACAYNV
jgi:hypothetical protein